MKKNTNRRGEETRLRVIASARAQFAKDGYDGATMRNIASAAGLPLALLHYHFGSKQDLYRAVWVAQYSSAEELARRKIYSLAPAEDPPELALRHVIEAALVGPIHLLNDASGSDFITILAQELADPKAEERGLISEFINPICDDTQSALRKLMHDLPDSRFRVGLMLTISASQQLIHYWTLSLMQLGVPRPEELERLMPQMIDFLAAGWQSLR